MLVEVTEELARVLEVDDLGALSVRHRGSPPGLARVLRAHGAGAVDGDHVWLDVAWLRRAGDERDVTWHAGFEAMLSYADSRSWVSGDGRRVRAHVDRSPAGD